MILAIFIYPRYVPSLLIRPTSFFVSIFCFFIASYIIALIAQRIFWFTSLGMPFGLSLVLFLTVLLLVRRVSGNGGFSGRSYVGLRDGAKVSLDELVIGSEVRTSSTSFSRIIGLSNKSVAPSEVVISLHTSLGILTAAPSQYVAAHSPGMFKTAGNVTSGDKLLTEFGIFAKVAQITKSKAQHQLKYFAVTEDHRIVVDGFVVISGVLRKQKKFNLKILSPFFLIIGPIFVYPVIFRPRRRPAN